MTCFFRIFACHDSEIYGPPQVHQIRIALVLNLYCLFFLPLFIVVAVVCLIATLLVITPFSKDISLQLFICLLILLPVGIEFEDIETVLNIDIVVQRYDMGNLVFFFYQIQFFLDSWIVLVFVLSHLE